MKFSPEQKKIFNKNLKSLKNARIYNDLKALKKPTLYKLKLGKDSLDINLQDLRDNALLYKDIKAELEASLKTYNDKYIYYPVLYYWGFGNGILYKALLQNERLKFIVVFETQMEILYFMFHLIDFSSELESSRLHILNPKFLDSLSLNILITKKQTEPFVNVYTLELHCDYYEKFGEEVLKFNQDMISAIKLLRYHHGNDSKDALQGISQTTFNLVKMITHPNQRELKKRVNLGREAIVVSTGPSLTKQLPLLKEYAKNAAIFCADSAYPILHEQGIKPDYVFSLERVDYTSELFNNDFGEFDEGIVFIVVSLTHPNTLQYLEKNKRFYMINLKSNTYRFAIFNEILGGQSVAHMAYELAAKLGYKNIFLIGQDLAYSEKGKSHPKGYLYGEDDMDEEGQFKDGSMTRAYGGEGLVETNLTWNIFREYFQYFIPLFAEQFGISTFNCTEGGARIEGAIEMPFKEACEKFLKTEVQRPLPKLDFPSQKLVEEYLFKTFAKTIKIFKEGDELCAFFENKIETINHIATQIFENKNADEKKFFLTQALNQIDEAKEQIEQMTRPPVCSYDEILHPLLYQFEYNIAKIYVYNPKNEHEAEEKSLVWIKEHLWLFSMIVEHIKIQRKAIDANAVNLFDELIKRGFEERLIRIQKRIMKGAGLRE